MGNGKVIFAANDETFSSDIFSINRDGTGRTNLTGSSDASESQPSFSPDGTRILYRKGDNTIAVMNADGTDPQTILTTVGPLYYPAWSPDGATIVFVADEALATQHDNTIDVVGADGSGRTTIVSAKGDYLSPSFSPDGSKIAYAANTGEMSIELFVVDSDGSNPQQITDDGTVHDSPVWSPVAASIAYVAAVPGTFASSIYLIKPDGTDAAPIPGANGGNPAWNRDGTEIAFGAFGVGISVANVDGTGKQLIANTSDGFDPDLE